MEIWIDPRDGKEWRVHFIFREGAAEFAGSPLYSRPGNAPEPSGPVAWFYYPAGPGTEREVFCADLRGDEDMDSMTNQEQMDLLDKAKKREGWAP